jgi:glycosyltransferase involved in cell wall biosynthesis
MKIAIFHNLPIGGAKRVVEEEIKYFSRNHVLKVFTLDIKPQKNRLIRDFDNFISLNLKHRNLAIQIDREDFDLVLVHPDKLTQAPFLLRYLKTPTVYFCEELLRIAYEPRLALSEKVGFHKKIYEKITRLIRKNIDYRNARSAKVIVVASKFIKDKVKRAYKRNALICPLGVDTNTFKPRPKVKKWQLMFIGDKDEINGYGLAREIAKELKFKLFVVTGHKLDDQELSEKYSESFVTICSSFDEPFGLVPLESMACGTPVLAVNEGGYKETIINGKTGYLLERNPEKFAEKILYLKNNPKVYKKMSNYAVEYVKRNWTWEGHNQILLKIFR